MDYGLLHRRKVSQRLDLGLDVPNFLQRERRGGQGDEFRLLGLRSNPQCGRAARAVPKIKQISTITLPTPTPIPQASNSREIHRSSSVYVYL
jgi:hypothetical protein